MSTTKAPRTARDLCAVLHAYGVMLEGNDLTFVTPLPFELEDAVQVLHTGVRAVLLGRAWWGTATEKARVVELIPAEPVPDDIALLAVASDERWDRVRPDAVLDFPHLFAPTNLRRRK